MIKYQTVLVLGAGSSAEVGLPTGAKLAQDLTGALDIRFKGGSDIVSGNQDIALALAYAARRADGPKADINEYFHAARRISAGVGLTSSIDTFIDVHRDNPLIARCGKIAIVQAILDAERSSSLHIDRQTTNKVEGPLFERATSSWFFQLARMLFDGLAKAKLDEVFAHLCVINFNYDRCLEHFLIHALSAAYGVETAHARQLVDKLRIWHPYGTVGLLSSTVDDQTQLATFGDKKTPEAVAVLADRIKTFTEQIGDEEAVRAPRKWLSEASAILFLGFGFNDQNMKLIKPHNSRGSQNVYATAAGMFDPDVAVARAGIVEMLELRGATDSNVFPVRTDLTCARLLQEYGRIIQAGIPWRRER